MRSTTIVHAAGGVISRQRRNGRLEVLLIHRPHRRDWTFPKGKLESGETHEECAIREVEEETGLRCALGLELPSTSHTDNKGRHKLVRYWMMYPTVGWRDRTMKWTPSSGCRSTRPRGSSPTLATASSSPPSPRSRAGSRGPPASPSAGSGSPRSWVFHRYPPRSPHSSPATQYLRSCNTGATRLGVTGGQQTRSRGKDQDTRGLCHGG
jgi:ADP-ribose pyrophosphatase